MYSKQNVIRCSQNADECNKCQQHNVYLKSVQLVADGAAFVSRSGSQTRTENMWPDDLCKKKKKKAINHSVLDQLEETVDEWGCVKKSG